MKLLSVIKKYTKPLVENLIITVMTTILLSSSLVFLFRKNIIDLHLKISTISVPLYTTILLISITLAISGALLYLKKKKNICSPIISFKYRSGDEKKIPVEQGGIKWIAYIPKPMFDKDEYVWLEGPFCPDCIFKLKWKKGIKNFWYCEECNKKFKPIKKTEQDCENFVKDLCYSNIFHKNKFKKQ